VPDSRFDVALGRGYAQDRAISTTALLGQVMFLVAVALGFAALGSYLGRDMAFGTARLCSFGGFGMLIVASFGGQRFRIGPFAMGWLFATALLIGLGLGPVLDYYAGADPTALSQAAAGTAATVAGAGALGYLMAPGVSRFMKPLSLIIFAVCIGTVVWTLFSGTISPVVSGVIYLLSAALIVVDFNYLRKHGTENDTIWLATGIFVSIINIFLSLLNIFSNR
jgi:FtsH-binding integral membrane protein